MFPLWMGGLNNNFSLPGRGGKGWGDNEQPNRKLKRTKKKHDCSRKKIVEYNQKQTIFWI